MKSDRSIGGDNKIAACGIIVLLAFALYANTIPNDYAFDDGLVITENHFVKNGVAGIKDILSYDSRSGVTGKDVKNVVGGRYRPLSLVTFAIEHQFFGLNPHVGHFVNIALYALTGILIYLILLRLLPLWGCRRSKNTPSPLVGEGRGEGKIQAIPIFPLPLTPSHKGREDFENILLYKTRWYLSVPFLTAILFIAHPIHTEVVANIKSRDEIMSFLFALATLWFVLNYLDTKKGRCLVYSAVTFFLALLSKENAATFILIIPLTMYIFTKCSRNKLLLVFTTLILPSMIFLTMRGLVIGDSAIPTSENLLNNPFIGAPLTEKYATISYTLGIYLKLLFFPHPLTYDYYPYHIPIIGWPDVRAIVPLIINILLVVIAAGGIKRKGVISYGILFYIITLLPVSNLFFPIGVFMAERFVYMPSLGFCFIVSYLLAKKLPEYVKGEKSATAIISTILIIVLPLYSLKTISRNRAWKNDFTLFSTDVRTSAESAKGNKAIGSKLIDEAVRPGNEAKRDEYLTLAIKHLDKTLEIYPEFADALLLLGNAYYEYNKDYEKVFDHYKKIIRMRPNYSKVYYNIAVILNKIGDDDFKIKTYEDIHSINPDSFDVNYALGILYLKKDTNKAEKYLESAAMIDPQNPDAFNNLGVIYYGRGDYKRAEKFFETALRLRPGDKQYTDNLGLARKHTNESK